MLTFNPSLYIIYLVCLTLSSTNEQKPYLILSLREQGTFKYYGHVRLDHLRFQGARLMLCSMFAFLTQTT
mgnify:CR=1